MKRTVEQIIFARPKRKRHGQPVQDQTRLDWIRTLPCVCCFRGVWSDAIAGKHTFTELLDLAAALQAMNGPQKFPTEAAHVGERGLSQLCSSDETAPLCSEIHHREGRESIHRKQKSFWTFHQIDREELLAYLKKTYAAEFQEAA